VCKSQGQVRVSGRGLFYLTLREPMLQNVGGHPLMWDLATDRP